MKKIFFFIFITHIINQYFVNSSPTFDVTKLKASLETDQIMIVIPYSYTSQQGRFYYYIKKEDGKWHEIINTESHIGANGLGKEKEGDNKTPVGKFTFSSFFGIYDNPGTKMPYIHVNDSIWWNCDSNSPDYNLMINTDYYTKEFDKDESEHIIQYNPGYEYIMNINYNPDRTPRKGCAIFLHCFTNNPYTGGCVAISKENMKRVITTANEKSIIIIDELKNIYNY